MTISIAILQQQPLFSSLTPETMQDLARVVSQRSYQADEIIQIEGDPCEWVGFVQAGALRIYRLTLSGREQVLSNLGPGMHFNSVPALEADSRLRASVRALTDLNLLIVNVGDYRRLIQTRSDLAFNILRDYARRLDHLTNLVEDLSLRSVRARLARFLLEQARLDKVPAQWTQDEIAAHLGSVRDVIGRTLRSFMDNGLIRREGGKMVILDLPGLEEEAKS